MCYKSSVSYNVCLQVWGNIVELDVPGNMGAIMVLVIVHQCCGTIAVGQHGCHYGTGDCTSVLWNYCCRATWVPLWYW